MSFREYLAKRRVTDTAAGDFVADAQRDAGLLEVQTWPELRAHLFARGAGSEAVGAGHAVWLGYCASQRRRAAKNA